MTAVRGEKLVFRFATGTGQRVQGRLVREFDHHLQRCMAWPGRALLLLCAWAQSCLGCLAFHAYRLPRSAGVAWAYCHASDPWRAVPPVLQLQACGAGIFSVGLGRLFWPLFRALQPTPFSLGRAVGAERLQSCAPLGGLAWAARTARTAGA